MNLKEAVKEEMKEHKGTYDYFIQCLKNHKVPTIQDFAGHIVNDHLKGDKNYYAKEGY